MGTEVKLALAEKGRVSIAESEIDDLNVNLGRIPRTERRDSIYKEGWQMDAEP